MTQGIFGTGIYALSKTAGESCFMAGLRICVLLSAWILSAAMAGGEPAVRYDEVTVADHVTTYRGNVVVEFRGFRFGADEVKQTADGERILRIEASGNPLSLTAAEDALPGFASAEARRLVYLVADNTLLLEDYEIRLTDGSVQKGRNFKLVFE